MYHIVCITLCVLREGPDLTSNKLGYLEKGEVVAVVQVKGNRLRCVRLRCTGKIDPHGCALLSLLYINSPLIMGITAVHVR